MKVYISTSTDLNDVPCGEYYMIDRHADTRYDDQIQEVLDDYGMVLVGWAIAKDEYYDAFMNNGIDTAVIAKDDTGKIGLYIVASDRVYDISSEVDNVIENIEDNYYR